MYRLTSLSVSIIGYGAPELSTSLLWADPITGIWIGTSANQAEARYAAIFFNMTAGFVYGSAVLGWAASNASPDTVRTMAGAALTYVYLSLCSPEQRLRSAAVSATSAVLSRPGLTVRSSRLRLTSVADVLQCLPTLLRAT